MKTVFLGLFLVASVLPTQSESLLELSKAASTVNSVYLTMGIDLELAELRFEKSRIEATGERDLLTAESTFLQAQDSYRRSVRDFSDQVINTVIDVAVAATDLAIAEINELSATEDQSSSQKQYERGLVSEEGLTEAKLKLRSAQLQTAQAKWDFEDAVQQLKFATGLTWKNSLLPEVPEFVFSQDVSLWKENDIALKRAQISVRLAELAYAALPGNAARYDRRLGEAALRKAQTSLQQAETESERSFRSTMHSLRNQYATLGIRIEELDLQRTLLEDAEQRYERSIIARAQRDQQKVRVLSAEKTHLQAVRTYLRNLVAYLIATDTYPGV